jgi:hypothetical protein
MSDMSTEQDYAGAAQWAENEMELNPESPTALRGDAAAIAGRKALEDALGKSAEDIQKGLGGRPTLDPDGAPSRLRTVRLGKALDSQLTKAAERESRDRSSVMRDAIAEYLNKTA